MGEKEGLTLRPFRFLGVAGEAGAVILGLTAAVITVAVLTPISLKMTGGAVRNPCTGAVGAGVLVALAEEIFFRGFIQPSLARTTGSPAVAIAGTALLFSIAHLPVYELPVATSIFLPGLMFGLLRQISGTVTAPAACHAACNVWAAWFWPF